MNPAAPGKEFIKKITVRTGALSLAERFAPPGAVILMYHSVQEDPRQFADLIGAGIIHATSVFRRHMEIIAREFSPVTLEDVLLFLKGEGSLPRKAVAVTFDDGFADNCEIAASILDQFGIRAAFYLTADLIGTSKAPWYCRLRHAFAKTRRKEWTDPLQGKTRSLRTPPERDAALLAGFDLCSPFTGDEQERLIRKIEIALDAEPPGGNPRLMMSWEEARRLQRDGHIAGSHTLTHPNLAHVASEERLRKELVESKLRLERELGSPVAHFSYPHPALQPQWTEKTIAMTASAGYKTAVTTTSGPVRAGANPLCLARVYTPRPENQFRWVLGNAFLGRRV